jgi:hypothetical protein
MIIDEEKFQKEVKKIVDGRTKNIIDKQIETMNFLLQNIHSLEERIKCLEGKRMTFVDEKMIDDYLSEGINNELTPEQEDIMLEEGMEEYYNKNIIKHQKTKIL